MASGVSLWPREWQASPTCALTRAWPAPGYSLGSGPFSVAPAVLRSRRLRRGQRTVLYRFENHVLDVNRRELRRGGALLAVEPKVFDLLVPLIANRNRVVSKDDLIAAVWNGRIVSESTLTSCINAARGAIGDSGDAQRLIKTLPRKGLRFVGDVGEDHESCNSGQSARLAQEQIAISERPLASVTPRVPDKPSIAVLPFTNMSGDPEQEYFSDGITEDIITALSRLRWFFVIARNSTFAYKGQAVDVRRVGRDLGVRYLLEGSVRK